MLKIYDKYGKKSKLVHYAGNNFVPYDYNRVNNLLTTDEIIYQKAKINKKNSLIFFPWVDFDNDYRFEGISDSKNINSYILNYNKFFPDQYRQALRIKDIFCSSNYKINFIENAKETEVPNIMKNSFATLHIKPIEGYGFSIIESMAKGRPVILYKPYVEGRIYRHWAIDMETCIYFENEKQLLEKFEVYEKNYEDMQKKCSFKIRSLLNYEKHNKNLATFLNNLV
jgi:glycosyltransferase involved in cell wall biosynthesis